MWRKSGLSGAFAALATMACFMAPSVVAQGIEDRVVFADAAEAGGVLTRSEIYLLNRSAQSLDFYLSLENSAWQRFRIAEEKAALIRARDVKVAIATALLDDTEGEISAPRLPPAKVREAGTGDGGLYHYAPFVGSERIELCWSVAADRWIAQRPHEGGC